MGSCTFLNDLLVKKGTPCQYSNPSLLIKKKDVVFSSTVHSRFKKDFGSGQKVS